MLAIKIFDKDYAGTMMALKAALDAFGASKDRAVDCMYVKMLIEELKISQKV